MASSRDKTLAIFGAAEKLNAALWHCGVDPAFMSVDQLHQLVEENWKVSVSFELVDVETDHVRGFIERYDAGCVAKIYIVKNMTPREKRLVGTKELCQVVLDQEPDWNTDGQDTLSRLVSTVVDFDAPENAAIRSEMAAQILAQELLYPHELRRADLAALEAGTVTLEELAGRYKIPVDAVEEVLAPSYLADCDRYWAATYAARRAAE